MFIDINKIGRERVTFDRVLAVPDLEGAPHEKIVVTRARLAGEAVRGSRGVDVEARLEAEVRLGCSRCAEPFEIPIQADFFLTLVPDATEFGAGETKVEPGDASLFYVQEGKADLVSIAAEQIYLNLPLKPVCKDDCKGLCPQCGANRNWTSCSCAGEEPDPRLAPLLQFKRRR